MPKNNNIDQKPQFFNMKVTETAANTFTEANFNTPVVHSLSNGKALVMEIFKIIIKCSAPELIAVTITEVAMQLTKHSQTAMLELDDPEIVIMKINSVHNVAARTAETIGSIHHEQVVEYDLSDGNGNGYLYAGREMFIGIQGANNAGVKKGFAKVLYKLVEVSAVELIGILQE